MEFPRRHREPMLPAHINTFSPHSTSRKKKLSNTRARAPSLRSAGKRPTQQAATNNRPATPTPLRTEVRPQILQRSSSYGPQLSAERVTKSVKKWARTAHLHPVKSPIPPALDGPRDDSHDEPLGSGEAGGSFGDVFSVSGSPTRLFAFPQAIKDQPPQRRHSSRRSNGRRTPDEDAENNWIDTDVGSEVDVQDSGR